MFITMTLMPGPMKNSPDDEAVGIVDEEPCLFAVDFREVIGGYFQ